jgi:hypothetical protein
VWEETRFDSGLYGCSVTREGDHGRLRIVLQGAINHTIHEETVKCERADTDKWRTRCENVISKPELREMSSS